MFLPRILAEDLSGQAEETRSGVSEGSSLLHRRYIARSNGVQAEGSSVSS